MFVFSCTVLFVSISQVIGCEDRLQKDLYCVGWGVKLYSNPVQSSMLFCIQELGLAVVGSQIVGLVPLKAILQTAEHYIAREKLFLLEEDQKLRLVVDRLGLHSLVAFNPKERIIE